jgi:uncharacterized circularly permuted ATP-grasp superfamily protein/uncharacterized alpha-E superfamily protein
MPSSFEAAVETPPGLAYAPPGDVYDEMVASAGLIRPHWQKLVAELESIGPSGIARTAQQATRLVHDNRVTYHAHERSADTPWEVDSIPLLFPPDQWKPLADGLAQRAHLLNEILVDLYGPQSLLRNGLLPPELVYSNPAFLLACHGSRVPHQLYLHLYAAHLARAPDGRWVILADRTQSPTGAGYAVENRIVIARAQAHMFDELQVQRLAPFFVTLRETLQSLATHHRDNPRVVLLTAGPESRTYFEDMYLARYLGYTMVEGGDLTVRDNIVFLKTLGGLLPVDVIFRRLSDEQCDPLELEGDTMAGVPGLAHAARRNHVVIANALGTGMLEAPVLQAFLPSICRHMLGEELLLPGVGTWWCGEEEGLRHTLANFGQLIVKPVFDARSTRPVTGDQLSSATREELLARIRARPHEFVAQEHIACSSAPVWNGNRLEPWHVALRAFAVATNDTYQVMPGGLPRVFSKADQLSDSMAAGQASKDVWVFSDGPVEQITLLRPTDAPMELRRSGNDLPSRVAENLYWLGRQVERVEGTVRLLRTIVNRITSEPDPGALPDLLLMVGSLSNPIMPRSELITRPASELRHRLVTELLDLVYDEQRIGSVRSNIQSIRGVASVARDRLSVDSWRILTLLDEDVPTISAGLTSLPGDMLSTLNQTVFHLAAFAGMGVESMTRGPGWRFLDMGRRVERAMHTMCLLRSALAHISPKTNLIIEALLEIADSWMTYKSRYLTNLQLAPMLDLLMTDESNPRSAAFQLAALAEHVNNLPRDQSQPVRSSEQRLILAAQTRMRLADVEQLCKVEADGQRRRLDRFLVDMAAQLRKLSDSVTHTYMIHAGPSRQMTDFTSGDSA